MLAEKAYAEDSAYDLDNLIKQYPGLNQKFIEKRDSLVEAAQEKYLENKKVLVNGISNKDFLVHFTDPQHLSSILSHGILSIKDQKDKFGKIEIGIGPDLQTIFGRPDCVSVFNIFKGADLEKTETDEESPDKKIWNSLQNKIWDLMSEFQSRYKERVFGVGGNVGMEWVRDPVETEKAFKSGEFSKEITATSGMSHFRYGKMYVNPDDKNDLRTLRYLAVGEDNEIRLWEEYGDPSFNAGFFEDIDNEKEDLLKKIKIIMEDAYKESVSQKSNLDVDEEWLDHSVFNFKFAQIPLILDPNLEKTFIASGYPRESFIEEKITPDKILGIKTIDEETKRQSFNLGKVGYSVVYKPSAEELKTIPLGDIIFKGDDLVLFSKSPYGDISESSNSN